jgi:hypothetical protein
MTPDPHDVARVYSGPLTTVEVYQQALREAGIESRVVGTNLTMVFGGAISDTIELWVHRGDLEKATAAIELYERENEERRHHHHHPHAHQHPTSDPKPNPAPPRKEPYVNPDPAGE